MTADLPASLLLDRVATQLTVIVAAADAELAEDHTDRQALLEGVLRDVAQVASEASAAALSAAQGGQDG